MNWIGKDVVLKHSRPASFIFAVAKRTTICLLSLVIMLYVAPLYDLKNACSDELEDWTFPFFNAQNTNCAPAYYGPSKSRLVLKWKHYLSDDKYYCINKPLTYHKKILCIGKSKWYNKNSKLPLSIFKWLDYNTGEIIKESSLLPYFYGYCVIFEDKLIYSSHTGEIVCLDANSFDLIWKDQLYEKNIYRPVLIPIVLLGKVYICSTEGELFSYELISGLKESIINLHAKIISQTPIDNNIFVSTKDGSCYCIDLTSRNIRWEYKTEYDDIDLPIISTNGIILNIYANTDFNRRDSSELLCLNKNNGTILWSTKESLGKWVSNLGVCIDDKLYCYVDFTTEISGYCCLDANTSKIIWLKDTVKNKENIFQLEGDISAYGNKIISGYGGNYYINDVDSGDYLSTFSTLEDYQSYPVVASYGYLYTADDYFIYCFENAPDVVTFTLGSKTYKAGQIEKEMDSPLEMIQNKLYISPNYLVEALGGIVLYDYFLRIITCSIVKDTVKMTIDKNIADINGKQVQIDPKNPKITPIIINGRTMVPVRFLAESLGCEVKWDANTKTITIEYKP